MRKVTFGGACSLDNFIARSDGAVDWLIWSDEAAEIMKGYWKNVDTIVMGRKTWDIAIRNAPGLKKKKDFDPYLGIKTYVFSRTLSVGENSGAQITDADPGKFVAGLKEAEGKEICVMGGGQLARSLFEANVIDEIGFNIHPVLLGSGIPLFHKMKRQIELEMIGCRPMKTGCVYVSYRVKK
ncbi:MAG: dihydrofolate reductase family protein [Acidobacteriota bacterium]